MRSMPIPWRNTPHGWTLSPGLGQPTRRLPCAVSPAVSHAPTSQKAAAKSRLHALTATQETPEAVLRDANLAIAQLEKRVGHLTDGALVLIGAHPGLERALTLLVGIKGIAETSAIALMGELLLLPPDLSHREWAKFAGLGPRAFDSGKGVPKEARISKAGNRPIRAALYMPALSAKQHDPHIRAYFRHLVANGKKPLQAACGHA